MREELKQKLPEKAFAIHPGNGSIIQIKRGVCGYFIPHVIVKHDEGATVTRQHIVELLNDALGVSPAQAQAMLTGSMFGWDCPGADPGNCAKEHVPAKGGS